MDFSRKFPRTTTATSSCMTFKHQAQMQCGCLSLLLLLPAAHAHAQLDPKTGHIKATTGVPRFDAALWNGAYKAVLRNMRFAPDSWPSGPAELEAQCSPDGFDTTPASAVKLGDNRFPCFYKNSTQPGTFHLWFKQHALAWSNANCYCYALNRFEGGFCVPGTSYSSLRRSDFVQHMTCPTLHTALSNDGAVPVTRQQALSAQPQSGHYIAVMARPAGTACGQPGNPNSNKAATAFARTADQRWGPAGTTPLNIMQSHQGPTSGFSSSSARGCSSLQGISADMHFLRKDSSGTWSHKLPGAPATDRDLEGAAITDPGAAVLPGRYELCGYYHIMPNKMPLGTSDPDIHTDPGPVEHMSVIKHWAAQPGVQLELTATPYNPDADALLTSEHRAVFEADLMWERQRGTPEYAAWKHQQRQQLGLGAMQSSDKGAAAAPAAAAAAAGAIKQAGRKLLARIAGRGFN